MIEYDKLANPEKPNHRKLELKPRIWTLDQYYGADPESLDLLFTCSISTLLNKQLWRFFDSQQELVDLGHTIASLVPSHQEFLDPKAVGILNEIQKELMRTTESSKSKTAIAIGHLMPRNTTDKAHETKELQRNLLELLRNNLLLCSSMVEFKNTGVKGELDLKGGRIIVSPAGICFYPAIESTKYTYFLTYWQIAHLDYFDQQLTIEYYPSPDSKSTEILELQTYLAQQVVEDIASIMLANFRSNRLVYYCHTGIVQTRTWQDKKGGDWAKCHTLMEEYIKSRSQNQIQSSIAVFEESKKQNDGFWFFQYEFQKKLGEQRSDCNSHKTFAFIVEKQSPLHKEEEESEEEDSLEPTPDQLFGTQEAPATSPTNTEIRRYSEQKYQLMVTEELEIMPELSSRRSSRRLSRTELLSFNMNYSSKPKLSSRRSVRQDEVMISGLSDKGIILETQQVNNQTSEAPTEGLDDQVLIEKKVEKALVETGLEGKPAKEVMNTSILAALKKLPPKKTAT